MPLDAETTAALDRIADRIEGKIERAHEQGAANARRVEDKVDRLAVNLAEVTTELKTHVDWDEERFDDQGKAIKEVEKKADRNSGSVAKLTGASLGGGGIVAAIMEFLGRGQGS